jgi:hypothetical protein
VNASGTQVEWNAVALNQAAAVSGQLGTGNGGTGLSTFTANGVVYASSSSVLATGSALTFDGSAFWVAASSVSSDSLNVNGFRFGSGTFKQQFSAGFDFQQYYTAAGQAGPQASIFVDTAAWGVKINGAEQMRLTSTGLGIGTSSPQAKLEIAQSADNTDGPKLRIANNGNTLSNGQLIGGIDFFNGDDSGEGVGAYIYSYTTDSIGQASGQDLRFATGGTTERMRLDSSGLLTVGNTSPAGSSQITAYGASNGQIAVQNSTNWSRFLQNANNLYIDNGVGGSAGNTIFRGSSSTIELMRLDSSGNLGLGFTPSAWGSNARGINITNYGSVSGNSNTGTASLAANAYEYTDNGWKRTNATSAGLYQISYTGAHTWSQGVASTANSIITFTQAMTLDASGNLGLGVTPSASWASGTTAFQFGPSSALYNSGSGSRAIFASNAIFTLGVSSAIYITSNAAAFYDQDNGLHKWYNAPSGTAGNAITFTQAMTLDASGILSVTNAIASTRINPRFLTATTGTSVTPDISLYDQYNWTALASNFTFNAPTGTPVNGNKLMFRITPSGTPTLTWNATYTAIGVTLPTTTISGKTIYVGCVYNADLTRWEVIAVSTQA